MDIISLAASNSSVVTSYLSVGKPLRNQNSKVGCKTKTMSWKMWRISAELKETEELSDNSFCLCLQETSFTLGIIFGPVLMSDFCSFQRRVLFCQLLKFITKTFFTVMLPNPHFSPVSTSYAALSPKTNFTLVFDLCITQLDGFPFWTKGLIMLWYSSLKLCYSHTFVLVQIWITTSP